MPANGMTVAAKFILREPSQEVSKEDMLGPAFGQFYELRLIPSWGCPHLRCLSAIAPEAEGSTGRNGLCCKLGLLLAAISNEFLTSTSVEFFFLSASLHGLSSSGADLDG